MLASVKPAEPAVLLALAKGLCRRGLVGSDFVQCTLALRLRGSRDSGAEGLTSSVVSGAAICNSLFNSGAVFAMACFWELVVAAASTLASSVSSLVSASARYWQRQNQQIVLARPEFGLGLPRFAFTFSFKVIGLS